VGDSRLFEASTAYTESPVLTPGSGYSGLSLFLNGGEQIAHGSTSAGSLDSLDLRGWGWKVMILDPTTGAFNQLTNANFTSGVDNFSGKTSGYAEVFLTSATANPSENGWHVISFDNINTIDFSGGGGLGDTINPSDPVGGWESTLASSTATNTTTVLNPVNVVTANYTSSSSADQVLYLEHNNLNVSLGSGNDTIYVGNSQALTLTAGMGRDTVVFNDASVSTANNNDVIHGQASSVSMIDLANVTYNWSVEGSSATHSSSGSGNVLDLSAANGVIDINLGSGHMSKITFDHVTKIVY